MLNAATLLTGAKSAALKLIAAIFSEKILLWLFIRIGKVLVAKTTTKHDDEWLAKVEQSLKDKGYL